MKVCIFGNTPQDMNVGSEAGITTIGVTTGIYSKKDIENAGADYVVSDLQNTQKILNIILGKDGYSRALILVLTSSTVAKLMVWGRSSSS
jgi:hypothetical protein